MEEILAFLLSKGTQLRHTKKEFLIRQGERSDKVCFVKNGVVRHYLLTAQGGEKTIRLSRENDFFYTSIVSYFGDEPSYIFCQCLTDCELIHWERSKLNDLFRAYPELERFKNQRLINFILEKHKKEVSLLTKNAEERFKDFCTTRLELFNRIPHHVIASYLDITPETLSRLRSRIP